MADRNDLKRQRLGFDCGPLAGTPTERLAKRLRALIERKTTNQVFWRWNALGYGGLYRTETGTQCVIVRVTDDQADITVSVGSEHRAGWIDRLKADGYTQAETIDNPEYAGKVRLVFDSRDPLENEALRGFLITPWLPFKERGAVPGITERSHGGNP